MDSSFGYRFKQYIKACALPPVLIIIGVQFGIFILATLLDAGTQQTFVISNGPDGAQTIVRSGTNYSSYLLCDRSLWHGEIWRPFTAMITHTRFMHLLMNMLLFFLMGHWFIRNLSLRTVLKLAIIAGVLGNIIHTIIDPHPVLGFSGANMALLVAATVVSPHDRIFFFPAWLLVSVYVFFDFIYFLNSFHPEFLSNTAYDVHLIGALIGFLAIKGRPLFKRTLAGWEQQRQQRSEAAYAEEMKRVDQILEKISSSGLHTLTDEERSFLKQHSEREQKRRS